MEDDLGALECLLQCGAIADVALAVGHLRPAVLARIERPAGDPDDPRDPLVGLQQRHKAEAECTGRTGHRHGEVGVGHWRLSFLMCTSGSPAWRGRGSRDRR
jgi:hypothetical protein